MSLLNLKTLPTCRVYSNNHLLAKLRDMTLTGTSWMRDQLDIEKEGTVIIAATSATFVGWSFLVERSDDRLQVAVFVREEFRRLGIGTRLVNRAKLISNRRGRELVCCPWDPTSVSFFKKQKVIESSFFA